MVGKKQNLWSRKVCGTQSFAYVCVLVFMILESLRMCAVPICFKKHTHTPQWVITTVTRTHTRSQCRLSTHTHTHICVMQRGETSRRGGGAWAHKLIALYHHVNTHTHTCDNYCDGTRTLSACWSWQNILLQHMCACVCVCVCVQSTFNIERLRYQRRQIEVAATISWRNEWTCE
jgi:hypothetical protein